MEKIDFSDFNDIFFIGIGGCFMSALAKYCLVLGKKVSGSDKHKSQITDELKKLGAKIFIGHNEKNIARPDAVVYTSAVSESNPELKKARGIAPVFKRSEFLGLILKNYSSVIAVSGCHGKTTVTSMIARALCFAGKTPAAFVGGEDKSFGNFMMGKDVAVTEACEYKKNFLDIKPTVSVILNIDLDHTDCYADKTELKSAFKKFSENSLKVVNYDDENCKGLTDGNSITFGLNKEAFFCARRLKKGENGYSFDLFVGGKRKTRVKLNVLGQYNVYNALAAFAATYAVGCPLKKVKQAIERFTSVKRRTEYLGEYRGKKVYADYAHHPNEISAVIPVFGKNSLFIFQPHTYSRTKSLMEGFTNCFKNVDAVIFKTYPAREKYDVKGDGYALYKALKKSTERSVVYAKNVKALKSILDASKAKNLVFVGAGDIYFTAQKYFIDKKRKLLKTLAKPE